MRVHHLGETIALGRLVKHYRLMARTCPQFAGFYRQRLRVAIAEYREQSATARQREAA